ncbi:hypothetical protein [Gluconobacter sp. OJB]|uniref:hypothetical protein n=1 Tax=Gluconobacter sp. OJB TaxID=3145196 RepID=UPI0031F9B4F6
MEENILNDKTENVIVQMLYDEIRTAIFERFSDNGEYSAKHLRYSLKADFERDRIRRWMKNKTPSWLYKRRNKEEFELNGKIWALRKEYEYISNFIQSYLPENWEIDNIHTTFQNCTYVNSNIKTYKTDRDDEILYRMIKPHS